MKKNNVTAYLIMFFILMLPIVLTADVTFEPIYNPSLTITPTDVMIEIDGNLSDLGWLKAAQIKHFHERHPGDMIEPAVTTEVYVTYDKTNLYVAFLCHDDPEDIRATMCQRDQFHGDDAVCLLVDTYGEASWAYEFFVNPYGIQKDNLWTSIAGEDSGYDLIWESAAQVTASGYQVEMAIPFTSLRFPNKDMQSWKMDFWRNRPRESYNSYSWAAYDRNEQCWPCQWGTVDGISDVQPGKGLEILPTFVANQSGSLSSYSDPNAIFNNDDLNGEFSLGGKYSVNSNISIEAAYNPDFSQIEADADQIDVNTTFALFYPERRPFFQEGRDLNRTLFNSFYTRTINDPQFAAKVISRMEKTSFSFVSAVDENTYYTIPLDQRSILLNIGQSVVNVLRGLRNIGDNSQVGFIVTDRRFEDKGSGTIAALDADFSLSRNYSLEGQWIFSHTKEPDNAELTSNYDGYSFDDDNHTIAFDGESFTGTALITQFSRNTRHWNFNWSYNQISPTYRTQTGYDPINNHRTTSLWSNYNIYPGQTSIFERISPSIYMFQRWNFDGTRRGESYYANFNTSIRYAQTNFGFGYGLESEVWNGEEFNDMWSINFDVGSRFNSQIGAYISISQGINIARYDMVKGKQTNLYASINFKPVDRLIIEPTVNYARSSNKDTGEELYSGYIARTRIRYQASRALSFRLVLQYNDFNESWDIDPLMTYRLNSFTVFYLGTTYDYNKLYYNVDNIDKWKLSSRQFFMKLQYLFRT